MSSAKDATDATFQTEALEDSKPTSVGFCAEGGGPRRQLGPVLDALAAEYADQVDVVKVNVDDNPAIASQYGITSIPAVYLFANGEVAKTSVGAKPKSALEKEFGEYLTPSA